MLAYTAAAWPMRTQARWPDVALAVGWIAHGLALCLDVVGYGSAQAGARFGFAPALSATVWIVIAVHAVESRLLPVPAVRLLLASGAAIVVLLAALYPGESRPHTAAGAAWLPLHWLLGVVSYGLFAVAVLHAWLLDGAERRLRSAPHPASGRPLAGSLPLLQLERL
ncbi:MAG TPA: cytochrome C assembly protein, partial [Burkholderiaceae bacterium]|nr:cytochrome C assembly protein [Burkholderiaceae bacterium]